MRALDGFWLLLLFIFCWLATPSCADEPSLAERLVVKHGLEE